MSASLAAESAPKILVFDVFGTVVDWYGSIVSEVQALLPGVNANDFALAWREGYAPALKQANESGEWVVLDVLHRRILDRLLQSFHRSDVSESIRCKLTLAWHRLAPWPDSVEGIARLKSEFMVCSLSNGNLRLLANMAKNADIPWDCILSAEVFKRYKPDPEVYLGVARVFDVEPRDVMLVAAHQDDLDAARECGLQTAYIERTAEFGSDNPKDVTGSPLNNHHAGDIVQLAAAFGC